MTIIIASGTRYAGEQHWAVIEAGLLSVVDNPLDPHTLREGEADGVDRICARVAESWGWTVERVPAEWNRCAPDIPEELGGCPARPHLKIRRGGGHFCPFAGPRRNQNMVDRRPLADEVVSFPALGCRGRSGTWDLIHRAADAGIPIRVFPLLVTLPAADTLPYPAPAKES